MLATCEWPCFTSTHSYSFPGRDSQIQTLLSRLQVASKEPVSTSRAAVRAEPSRLVSVQQRPSDCQRSCSSGHLKRSYVATTTSKDARSACRGVCRVANACCTTRTPVEAYRMADMMCFGRGSSQHRGQISMLQSLCESCSHCYDSCILAVFSPSTR